jgi:hypothetical protein
MRQNVRGCGVLAILGLVLFSIGIGALRLIAPQVMSGVALSVGYDYSLLRWGLFTPSVGRALG